MNHKKIIAHCKKNPITCQPGTIITLNEHDQPIGDGSALTTVRWFMYGTPLPCDDFHLLLGNLGLPYKYVSTPYQKAVFDSADPISLSKASAENKSTSAITWGRR